ncbi:MAG: YunG family protein [Patescibacteria group bacterium]
MYFTLPDYLGGELLYCKHQHHYWNRLPNGQEVDLTRSQFPKGTIICIDKIITSKKGVRAKRANTEERYKILKSRVITAVIK